MLTLLFLACAPKNTDSAATGDHDTAIPDEAPPPTLLVSGYNSDAVHQIDTETGTLLATAEGIPGAQSIRPAPDGGLVVVAEKTGELYHLDEALQPSLLASGFKNPTGAIYSTAGDLYVVEFSTGRLLRVDGGEHVVVAEGLEGADAGLIEGPGGLLWVPCFSSNQIVAIEPSTGIVQQTWTGISRPRTLWFDAGGDLWATAWGNGVVFRIDPDGDRDRVASVDTPSGLVAAEGGESLWVASDQDSLLTRIDAQEGDVLETLDAGALGVDGATFLAWGP